MDKVFEVTVYYGPNYREVYHVVAKDDVESRANAIELLASRDPHGAKTVRYCETKFVCDLN